MDQNKISSRNDQAKDKMILSEESSRAIFEMGNVELVELKKKSETINALHACITYLRVRLNVNVENYYDPIKYDGPNPRSIRIIDSTLLSYCTSYFERK